MKANSPTNSEKGKRHLASDDSSMSRKRPMPGLRANGIELNIFDDDDEADSSDAEFFVEVGHPSTASFPASIPAISSFPEYLTVDHQVWEEAPCGVVADQAANCSVRAEILLNETEKYKMESGQMREIDFYDLMFPADYMQVIIDATNMNLALQNAPLTTKGEFYRMLGIRLAIALDMKKGIIGDFWSAVQESGTIYRPPRYYERFGMTKLRWEQLTSLWSLEQSPPSHIAPQV